MECSYRNLLISLERSPPGKRTIAHPNRTVEKLYVEFRRCSFLVYSFFVSCLSTLLSLQSVTAATMLRKSCPIWLVNQILLKQRSGSPLSLEESESEKQLFYVSDSRAYVPLSLLINSGF
ncbi:hypothetical protein V3C99_002812 [Haemonchus contortus]|uniref:Ovule protein n=1 Tax=Haemonchus contortus TaxID=6289 RepID=A0A7I4YAK5_HAECO